jgi:hypothetical protein
MIYKKNGFLLYHLTNSLLVLNFYWKFTLFLYSLVSIINIYYYLIIGLLGSSSTDLIANVNTVLPTYTAALSFLTRNGLLRWIRVPNLESLSNTLNWLSWYWIIEWTLDTLISLILMSQAWPLPILIFDSYYGLIITMVGITPASSSNFSRIM